MAGKRRWKEFQRYPTYERAYRRAFAVLYGHIQAKKIPTKWKSAEDIFYWWMEDNNTEGQISLMDLEEWGRYNS